LLLAGLAGCDGRTPPPTPNIVVISFDALPAATATSAPNLQRLSAEGALFQQAFSQANTPRSSLASMLTGRHLLDLHPAEPEAYTLPDTAIVVAEVLGYYSYSTAAFVAGIPAQPGGGFDQGMAVYQQSEASPAAQVGAAADWVSQQAREPFLLTIQSPGSDLAEQDAQLGRLLDSLDQAGVLDDSFLLVTAGHHPGLPATSPRGDEARLTDSSTRIPLLLWGAGLPPEQAGTLRADTAQSIDIAPTLLAIAQAQPPAGIAGRSLLEPAASPRLIFQTGAGPQLAVRSAEHRLVFRDQGLPLAELLRAMPYAPLDAQRFGLYEHRADPLEGTDKLQEQPAVAEALRGELVRWIQSCGEPLETGAPIDDPAFRQLLKDRGYW